jgi:hypothetical protein
VETHRENPQINSFAVDPRYFINEYLQHVSGPTGSDDNNMVTVASPGDSSVFAYTVPVQTEVRIARMNLGIVDAAPTLTKFGGIAALTNGVLMDVTDRNGLSILDLTAGRPVVQNADYLYLAGIDMEIATGMGLDVVKVRYSLFKSGANLRLKAGEQIRFTIQDDLTGIDQFRCMVQGLMTI